ncbi:hypothetical protein OG599_21810 [Streptomyces sp. NBC_01335]|uniref:hypothetical protein n=1 Tax=Streptomyces sp. NBC_01335 TaxID=2903828 RepID=UPI002E11BCB2|nr:hypothetical protein OG599_21810 [Streptomyces sp. NBC_01335]
MSATTAPTARPTRPAPGRRLPLVLIAVRQYRWVALVLVLLAARVCAALLYHYGSWADATALLAHVGGQEYHFGRYANDAHHVTEQLVNDGASLAFQPALLAAIVTAVLTAREWESRRVVLALTQSVTPRRWFTVRWAVLAAVLAAVTIPPVVLYRISAVHGFRLGLLTYGAERQNAYYTIGPVTVAHVLLGVAAGALAGTLLRRTLPALVAAPVLTWLVAGVLVRSRAVLLVDFPLFSQVDGFHLGGVFGLQFYDALPQDSFLMNALKPGDYWGFQIASSVLVLAAAALLTAAALRVLRRRTAQY